MSLASLGIGYLATGGVIAAVIAVVRRRLALADAVLLVGLWPLYAPLSLPGPRAGTHHREAELLAALARAKASPLAAVLPDADSARMLGARLREAGARLAELDEVLARPDFDPAAAGRRADELAGRGQAAAAQTARLRVRTLGQLRALRERYRSELDEVGELVAQLVTQAELVRLQPAIAHSSGELVRELVSRVEGLGDLFAYQASIEATNEPTNEPTNEATNEPTGEATVPATTEGSDAPASPAGRRK
ncbi:MAG TPA: PT domain-containing protein [Kofleriaceae bacterium]|nr:PT domain-containing protein [Kofleriaceae bacterium]